MISQRSALELHIQTIASGVILALLLWFGVTLLDVQTRLVRMEAIKELAIKQELRIDERVSALEREINEMKLTNAKREK